MVNFNADDLERFKDWVKTSDSSNDAKYVRFLDRAYRKMLVDLEPYTTGAPATTDALCDIEAMIAACMYLKSGPVPVDNHGRTVPPLICADAATEWAKWIETTYVTDDDLEPDPVAVTQDDRKILSDF